MSAKIYEVLIDVSMSISYCNYEVGVMNGIASIYNKIAEIAHTHKHLRKLRPFETNRERWTFRGRCALWKAIKDLACLHEHKSYSSSVEKKIIDHVEVGMILLGRKYQTDILFCYSKSHDHKYNV